MIFYRTGQSWFPRKLDSLEPGKLVLFICNSKPGAPSQSLPGRQPHPPLPRKNGSKKSFPSQAENWKMHGRSRTLLEVGKELGISRERVRQLEVVALMKLRGISSSATLRECI